MRYINESLLQTEKLVYANRPHWIVFGPSVATLIVAILVWVYLPSYIGYNQPLIHGFRFSQLLAIVVAIAGIFSFIRAFIFYSTSEYGVTNQRVIMKRGWIQRDSVEIFLQRLEAVNVSQTVLGRILNYGTVFVVGTGGTTDAYYSVPAPIQFRRIVQQQLNQLSQKD